MDQDLKRASIVFLRPSTIDRLSVQLNQEKLLVADNGQLRDWRGVYEMTGLNSRHVLDKCRLSSDPFNQLLDQWKHCPNATIHNLLQFLAGMERYDIIDDNIYKIIEDVKYADTLLQKKGLDVRMIENAIAASERVLTYDDIAALKTNRELARYDVLILHSEADVDFAEDVTAVLENQNIRVCLKERDLIVGTLELEAVTNLITERCNKVAVIITPNFFTSRENARYASLAQSDAITQDKRSFLPVILQPTDLPLNIQSLTKLRVHNNKLFWRNLCTSIHDGWEEDKQSRPLPEPLKQPTNNNVDYQPSPSLLDQVAPMLANYQERNHSTASAQPTSLKSPSSSSPKTSFIKSIKSISIKPFRNIVAKKKSPQPVQEFTNALWGDEPVVDGGEGSSGLVTGVEGGEGSAEMSISEVGIESSMIRLLDNAPQVPMEEPGRKGKSKSRFGFNKTRAENYKQMA